MAAKPIKFHLLTIGWNFFIVNYLQVKINFVPLSR